MVPIRFQDVIRALDAHTPNGVPIPFEITFVTFSRTRRTGGEVVTMKNCILKKWARNLPRAERRVFVPANRRDIPSRAQRTDILDLYNVANGLHRKCYARMIVAFNGREVTY